MREQLRELVRQTDATEIMAMEQQLIDGGMKVEEVRAMCDLHSQVTRDILVPLKATETISPGHPVDTFRRENAALSAAIKTGREVVIEVSALDGEADATEQLDRMRRVAKRFVSKSISTTSAKSTPSFRRLKGTALMVRRK